MHRIPFWLGATALASALAISAAGASLSGTAQSVMPSSTRQVISLNYHRLAADPVAQQLEAQLLPPEMQGLNALLAQGGIQPTRDLNRLTFATFGGGKGVELIGIAEGNFEGFQAARFFTKTTAHPTPPQVDGVTVYSAGGLEFFLPDPTAIVFGSAAAVHQAIQTEQGGSQIGNNEQLSDLIAGTESSDVWSVLDAGGARAMVTSMLGASTGPISPGMIASRFDGARYTISFQNTVQVNLELMTTDTLSAAALSTGLNADIALRTRQEKDPAARSLLNQIQVNSAGNDAFLQVSAPESNIASLMRTDLMRSIIP